MTQKKNNDNSIIFVKIEIEIKKKNILLDRFLIKWLFLLFIIIFYHVNFFFYFIHYWKITFLNFIFIFYILISFFLKQEWIPNEQSIRCMKEYITIKYVNKFKIKSEIQFNLMVSNFFFLFFIILLHYIIFILHYIFHFILFINKSLGQIYYFSKFIFDLIGVQ